MNKEKQIEEMVKSHCVFYGECKKCPVYPQSFDPVGTCFTGCRMLYNAGYRKASDIINEFSEELIKRFNDLEYNANTSRKTVKIDELRDQVDWVLHEVSINTIREFTEKYVEAMDG